MPDECQASSSPASHARCDSVISRRIPRPPGSGPVRDGPRGSDLAPLLEDARIERPRATEKPGGADLRRPSGKGHLSVSIAWPEAEVATGRTRAGTVRLVAGGSGQSGAHGGT